MRLSVTEWDARPGVECLHRGQNSPNAGRAPIPGMISEARASAELQARPRGALSFYIKCQTNVLHQSDQQLNTLQIHTSMVYLRYELVVTPLLP